MTKLLFVPVGAMLAGSLAVVACASDYSESAAPPPAQGELEGPCYGNSTCNVGLACSLVGGTAKCTPSSEGSASDASANDASADASTTGSSDGASSGLPECTFAPTKFPCGSGGASSACYGAIQSCTVEACNLDEIQWRCNSSEQCGGSACCLATANAAFDPGADCAEGKLKINVGVKTGTTCASTPSCSSGELQLCRSNADCLAGQRCNPVSITNPIPSLTGTMVAVCTVNAP